MPDEDIDRTYLLAMKIGECLKVKGKGHMIEIHRVYNGWIHVFQLNQSQLTTNFVPEELDVIAHGRTSPNRIGL